MMLVAAFAAIAVGAATQSWVLAVLAAVASSMLMALLFAVVTIRLRADFIVAGIGINILASGVTVFLLEKLYGNQGRYTPERFPTIWKLHVSGLDSVPIAGPLLEGQSIIFFLAVLAVPLSWFLLYRTRLGLRLRATGENPEAVAARGVSPARMQFIAVMLSGLAGGLAGAQLSMATLEFFVRDMANGRGFIGLAAMLFADGQPGGSLIASTVFGGAGAISDRLQSRGLPPQFVLMAPYVITVAALVLAALRRRRRAELAA
jgi:simple sugar transport system permease protein